LSKVGRWLQSSKTVREEGGKLNSGNKQDRKGTTNGIITEFLG